MSVDGSSCCRTKESMSNAAYLLLQAFELALETLHLGVADL